MTRLGDGWRRVTRVWRRDVVRDVDAEVEFHLSERAAELERSGERPDVARAKAEAEFGAVRAVREGLIAIDERVARRSRWRDRWEAVAQDFGYVIRSLRRSPGFFVAVSLTLALGIGANAAIFSVLDRLYLEAPPGVRQPEQLHRVVLEHPGTRGGDAQPRAVLLYDEFRGLSAALPTGVSIGGYAWDNGLMGRSNDRRPITEVFVIGDYFRSLGVAPAAGRFFAADELAINASAPVVVISERVWQRDFGGRGDAIGQVITVDGLRYTIIGVVRGDFHGADNNAADIWLPLDAERWRRGAGEEWYHGTAMIQTVIRVPSAAEDAAVTARATMAVRRVVGFGSDSDATAALIPLVSASIPGEVDPGIGIAVRLAVMSAIILLIAGANVTNLFLARNVRRRREIAVRLALGIGRARLVALLIGESVVAALTGGIIALLAAAIGGRVLRTMLLPSVHWTDAALNRHVISFTVLVAVVAGVAAGIVPALQSSRPDVATALKGDRRGGGQARSRLRSILVAAQAAFTVLLLVGAGLVVRSLAGVIRTPTGYDSDRLVFASVAADPDHRNRSAAIRTRLPELAASLSRLPGVERTALADNVPLWTISWLEIWLPGRDSVPTIGGEGPGVSFVSPDYFATAGIHLLRGTLYRATDRFAGTAPVIVDETMAKMFWPGADPIGQCLVLDERTNGCSTVVGVVSDVHSFRIIESRAAMHYFVPPADTGFGEPGVLAIRAAPGKAHLVASEVRRALADEFAGWAEPTVTAMSDVLAPQLHPWRMGAALFSAAALLALLVAVVGIYSTISYTFSQRTHEIGVRMALGARASSVLRLVVGEGVRIVLAGVVIGVLLALAGGKLIASLLYDTSPHDPLVLVAVSLSLLLIAIAACLVPAWRALRIDPVQALKAE